MTSITSINITIMNTIVILQYRTLSLFMIAAITNKEQLNNGAPLI